MGLSESEYLEGTGFLLLAALLLVGHCCRHRGDRLDVSDHGCVLAKICCLLGLSGRVSQQVERAHPDLCVTLSTCR